MFEARNSRWRLALMFLGCAAFVAIGLWMVGAFGADHPQGLMAILSGWLCTLFFAVCGVIALMRMRDADVVMRIDARGIWWKQWSDSVIPWSNISGVGIVTMHRQKMLGVALHDRSASRASTLLGRLASANEALVGYPVSLNVTGTDRSFDDLVEAVERFWSGSAV